MTRLRDDLLRWLLLPLLLLWALAFLVTVQRSRAQADEAHDRVLLGSAMVIAERIAVIGGRVVVDVPASALRMLEVEAGLSVHYQVSCQTPPGFIGGQRDLNVGLGPARQAVGAGETPMFWTTRLGAQPVRVVALRRSIVDADDCRAVLVRVAESTAAREAMSERILVDAAVMQLALIASAGALIALGVRRGLWPLRRVRDEVALRHPDDLSPIETQRVPREVVPLVDAINLQMRRQRDAHQAQQRFVADASHQLKTPLAVLKTQAALALSQQDPARMRDLVQEMHDSLDCTARVVRQLLALLRSDPAVQHAAVRVDLLELAREAAFELLPLALARRIELVFEGDDPAPVHAHAALLHEMVGNLVDNAIRYTPDGGRIRVAVACAPMGVVLQVADSGPGIVPAERDRVFQRFYRSPGTSGEGCGLGLAIVRQVAERYGATVTLGDAPEGGLVVSVRFAAPPA